MAGRIVLIVLCCAVFMVSPGCKSGSPQTDTDPHAKYYLEDKSKLNEIAISEEQAIVIADRKMFEMGYQVKVMNMSITLHDRPWNDLLPKENSSEYVVTRRNKLMNKIYWCIYYSLKPTRGGVNVGGDAGIFIDVKTGDILAIYRGE
jgi:hypothetical protein